MSMTQEQQLQIIIHIVQKHGCTIQELDLEKKIIDIDGPTEGKINCAMELEQLLDE